jgi:hypothetical protein
MNTRRNMNADNAGLQPMTRFCIGYVDFVNGDAAREVPGFIPTRAELVELAKHYESIFLDRSFFLFRTRQIGSTDLRLAPFAERRVARIIDLVGVDAAEAVQQVRDEFASRVGACVWKRFRKYVGPRHIHGVTTSKSRRWIGMRSQRLTKLKAMAVLPRPAPALDFIKSLPDFETHARCRSKTKTMSRAPISRK